MVEVTFQANYKMAAFQVLHCEVIFTNPKNLHWGTVSDGEISGIYLEVTEERADFALGGLTLTYDRCQVTEALLKWWEGPLDQWMLCA